MYNSGDAAEQVVRISLEGYGSCPEADRLGGKEYRCHALRCLEKSR